MKGYYRTSSSGGRLLPLILAAALFSTGHAAANWDVNFLNFTADLGPAADNNFIMEYEIGKSRDYTLELLAPDCESATTGNAIARSKNRRDVKTDSHDDLTVGYDIHMSTLLNSNIWNETSNEIEFCHILRLQLVSSASDNPVLEDLDIALDKRTFSTAVDFSANFSTNNIGLGYDPRLRMTYNASFILKGSSPDIVEGYKILVEEALWEVNSQALNVTGVAEAEVVNVTIIDIQQANSDNNSSEIQYEFVSEEPCEDYDDCMLLKNTTTMYADSKGFKWDDFLSILLDKIQAQAATNRHRLSSMAGDENEYENHHDQRKLISQSSEITNVTFGDPIYYRGSSRRSTNKQHFSHEDFGTYVEACKCDGAQFFACNTGESLNQNDELHICIWSVSDYVKVDYLDSMVSVTTTSLPLWLYCEFPTNIELSFPFFNHK